MTQSEINEIFDSTIADCRAVLCGKADEYVGKGDRLSNFKHAAHLQNLSLPAALGGMMAKHTVSVYDMIYRYQNGERFTEEKWAEKVHDHINYLILLQAVLAEERKTSASPPPTEKAAGTDVQRCGNCGHGVKTYGDNRYHCSYMATDIGEVIDVCKYWEPRP